MEEIANIHRRVLQLYQRGGNECGSRRACHFFVVSLAGGGSSRFGDRFPRVAGKKIPFVQVALGFGEAFQIQESPDGPGARGQFSGVGRVTMPGKEIERHIVLTARAQKFESKIRRNELTFHKTSGGSEGWTADLQGGELLFDGESNDAIESQVVVVRPAPHGRAVLGFVPNLPVANFVVKSVRPSFVVMPNDAEADRRPFFHVGGRMGLPLHTCVLDALAKAVNRFRAGCAHRGDVFVSQPEIIALR